MTTAPSAIKKSTTSKKVSEFYGNLNEFTIFSTPSILIDEFEEHITKAALKDTAAKVHQN